MADDRTRERLRQIHSRRSDTQPKHPSDKREYARYQGGCVLIYQDKSYDLIDWSAGGCAVDGITDVAEGSKIEIALKVSGPRTTLTQKVEARVLRVENSTLALMFLDLSVEERDLLLIAQGAFSENIFVVEIKDDRIF